MGSIIEKAQKEDDEVRVDIKKMKISVPKLTDYRALNHWLV